MSEEAEAPKPVESPLTTLANSMYEPAPPKPEGDVERPPAAAADAPEAPEGEETPPETPPEAAGGDEEGDEISTVGELAQHLEAPEDWLYGLKIEQKVNGEVVQSTIADELAIARKVRAGDAYLDEGKRKAKALMDDAAAQRQGIMSGVTAVAEVLSEMEAAVKAEYETIDWNKLRVDDPAEWTARQRERETKMARIGQIRGEAERKVSAALQQIEAQNREKAIRDLPKQQEILHERVPEWKDKDKAAKERDSLMSYLNSEGFTESEVNVAAMNGRVLALAIKAMRYDESKAKSAAIKKKVVRIPKVIKPGSSQQDKPPKAPAATDPVTLLYGSS